MCVGKPWICFHRCASFKLIYRLPYQCFGKTCCLDFKVENVSELYYRSTKLHGIMSQKTLTFTVMSISNLTNFVSSRHDIFFNFTLHRPFGQIIYLNLRECHFIRLWILWQLVVYKAYACGCRVRRCNLSCWLIRPVRIFMSPFWVGACLVNKPQIDRCVTTFCTGSKWLHIPNWFPRSHCPEVQPSLSTFILVSTRTYS